MTFAYIAGFFDGEGSVRYQKSCYSSQITLVQSTTQDRVLFEIQRFLTTQGILAHLHISNMNYVTREGRRSQLRTLSIGESASLIKFLEGVLPYLRVKRKKSLTALKLARTKQRRKDATKARLRLCEQAYKDGASTLELRKRYGVNHDQIRRHFTLVGIPLRDLKAAAQNRYRK